MVSSMSAGLSLRVLNVIWGGVPISGRLSAFTPSRHSQALDKAGVGVACGADCGPYR